MGPNGLFYVKAVGDFGVVSAGRNWDRLAITSRRRELSLVGDKKPPVLLFPDDALDLAENAGIGGTCLVEIFLILIIGYPAIEGKCRLGNYLVWIGFSIDVDGGNSEFSKLNVFRRSENYANRLFRKNSLLTKRNLLMVLRNGYRRCAHG